MIDKTLDKINTFVPEKWRWVLQHGGFRKYFKNTGWMFFSQLLMIFSFVVNIWIARYLGPTSFGTLSYILAFVGMFSFIANLGMNDILVRELVRHPEKKDELLGTAARVLLIAGLISFLISSLSGVIFEPNHSLKLFIILYSTIFLFSPINVISSYFQSVVQAKNNAYVQIVGVLLVSLVKIAFILLGKSVAWFVAAFVLDYLIGFILYIIIYRRSKLKMSSWKFDKLILKKLLFSSILMTFSAALGYLLMKVDQVMVKFYLGEISVGFYSVAVRLSEIWYFIPGIICGSLFPAIINSKKINSDIYKKRMKHLFLLLFSIALSISLIMTFASSAVIHFLFGDDYIKSAPILSVYIWSGIGFFLSIGINKYFMAENKINYIFFINLVAVVINLILNFILIPRIGLMGAALSTLISYSMLPFISLILIKIPYAKKSL